MIVKLPAQSGPVATWSATLPNDPGLVGQKVYMQAVHLFGVTPFGRSNARDLCLGH